MLSDRVCVRSKLHSSADRIHDRNRSQGGSNGRINRGRCEIQLENFDLGYVHDVDDAMMDVIRSV
jgi:hypothetical protein